MSTSYLYLRIQPSCSFLQEACLNPPWWKSSLLGWTPKVWCLPFRTFHFLHSSSAPLWVPWVPTSSDSSTIILPQRRVLFYTDVPKKSWMKCQLHASDKQVGADRVGGIWKDKHQSITVVILRGVRFQRSFILYFVYFWIVWIFWSICLTFFNKKKYWKLSNIFKKR